MNREELILKMEKEFTLLARRYRREINELFGNELSGHEYGFLASLAADQPQIASVIAKRFEVTPSFATMAFDKLIRKGFVHRERSRSDRRVVQLTVTESGMALYNKLKKVRTQYMHHVLENVSDEELQELTDLLAKFN
jgi:DNA-binding MarR family transcriptional regulator